MVAVDAISEVLRAIGSTSFASWRSVMNGEVQVRLLASVYSCLRPLARILLRSGVSYRQFSEAAKRAFVHESFAEKDLRGRPINASRVAVRTGLSRKEVRRLLESGEWVPSDGAVACVDQSGPPSKVLHAWHTERRFLSTSGLPLNLPFDSGSPSFCDVVRAVAGDVPPGAVRAELKRAGAIADLEDGRIRVLKRYFVPGDFDEKAITVISGILFPLTAGVDHNSNPGRSGEGFIQRFAFSDRIDPASVPTFRKWSRAEATRFVESMDDWLASNESRASAYQDSGQRDIVGVGVFYYEGPSADQPSLDVGQSQGEQG